MAVTSSDTAANRNPTQWPDIGTKMACLQSLLDAIGGGRPQIAEVGWRLSNTDTDDWLDPGAYVGPGNIPTTGAVVRTGANTDHWPAYATKAACLTDIELAAGGGPVTVSDIAQRLGNTATDVAGWANASGSYIT